MVDYYLCSYCEKKAGYTSTHKKKEVCDTCKNLFERVEYFSSRIVEQLKKYEFDTLSIGVILPKVEVEKEEKIFKELTSSHVKPTKIDFGEQVGYEVAQALGKTFQKDNPDITVTIDPKKDKISLQIKPLYIYGIYKKFLRGIPQTKWPCSKCRGLGCKVCDFTGQQYPETVEDLIAQEFLKATKGEDSKFHGAGREDIDALNFGGREFVLDIRNPKIRTIDLEKTAKISNKANKDKVEVSDLRYSTKKEIIMLKEKKSIKTYRALTKLDNSISKDDLKKLDQLNNLIIDQRTPERVSHRRGDLVRKRKVFEIKYNFIDKTTIELFIKGEAGLYIKELISGDSGRTKPSVAQILKVNAVVEELDVVKIED